MRRQALASPAPSPRRARNSALRWPAQQSYGHRHEARPYERLRATANTSRRRIRVADRRQAALDVSMRKPACRAKQLGAAS